MSTEIVNRTEITLTRTGYDELRKVTLTFVCERNGSEGCEQKTEVDPFWFEDYGDNSVPSCPVCNQDMRIKSVTMKTALALA